MDIHELTFMLYLGLWALQLVIMLITLNSTKSITKQRTRLYIKIAFIPIIAFESLLLSISMYVSIPLILSPDKSSILISAHMETEFMYFLNEGERYWKTFAFVPFVNLTLIELLRTLFTCIHAKEKQQDTGTILNRRS